MSTPDRAVWSSIAEDYQRSIVPGFRPAARALCEFLGVGPGDRVLDVGCGPGTASFAALGLGAARVVGVDFAVGMVAAARRAAGGDPRAMFLGADARALPVADGAFDVALSSFGVIFAPDPPRAVREMGRALRPGGRGGILAWPRSGTLAEFYEIVARQVEPAPGAHDPFAWGDPAQAARWFAEAFRRVEHRTIAVPFEAPSVEEGWRILRSAGRLAAVYPSLPEPRRQALDREMLDYLARHRGRDGALRWPREAIMVRGVRET